MMKELVNKIRGSRYAFPVIIGVCAVIVMFFILHIGRTSVPQEAEEAIRRAVSINYGLRGYVQTGVIPGTLVESIKVTKDGSDEYEISGTIAVLDNYSKGDLTVSRRLSFSGKAKLKDGWEEDSDKVTVYDMNYY